MDYAKKTQDRIVGLAQAKTELCKKLQLARSIAMGVPQGPTGFKPAQPKPPTDLEKDLKAIPAHPWTFDVMRDELKAAGQNVDELIRNAAREYFTYLLMAGADKALLEQDHYWKYMEE